MLASVLAGSQPAPLVDRRSGGSWESARSSEDRTRARWARVVEVVPETPTAVSLWLEAVDGGGWSYLPGQFLLLSVAVEGVLLRRAYSISGGSRDGQRVRVTVKRLPGGRVSRFVHDAVHAGQRFRVEGPAGRFTWSEGDGRVGHLVLIGGGSGITPLRSIAQAALEGDGQVRISLLYGNRSREEIIFAAELAHLQGRFPGRMTVRHVVARPAAALPEARVGVLDDAAVADEVDGMLGGDALAAEFFSCGPAPAMAAVRRVLLARGIAESQLHEERFISPTDLKNPRLGSPVNQEVTIVQTGASRSVQVPPGQTILAAARAAGVPLPSSCAMGGCGACKVRLREGKVDLAEPNCLSSEERARGEILTCVGHPRGPVTLQVGT